MLYRVAALIDYERLQKKKNVGVQFQELYMYSPCHFIKTRFHLGYYLKTFVLFYLLSKQNNNYFDKAAQRQLSKLNRKSIAAVLSKRRMNRIIHQQRTLSQEFSYDF